MEKRKTNILLELIDDMINEYPNTKEYTQQKLYEKCDREGIPTDKIIFFFFFFFFFFGCFLASLEATQTKHII